MTYIFLWIMGLVSAILFFADWRIDAKTIFEERWKLNISILLFLILIFTTPVFNL